MRIALISDIHGNLVSLQAVLADIDQARVDRIICLGDVATLGPQPHQVISHIRALGCTCIQGNHDAILLDPKLGRSYMNVPWFLENVEWCSDQLLAEDFDFLRTFQPTIELELDDGVTFLGFHGSPRSNLDIILATTPEAEIKEMLAGHEATLMGGGHTHIQMMRRCGGVTMVNVGSVGLPFEQTPSSGPPNFLPWSEYSIISCKNGLVSVDLRRVAIDLDEAKRSALVSGMPDRLDWVRNWMEPSRDRRMLPT